jgi:NHLM bacteriocin system secretion protein
MSELVFRQQALDAQRRIDHLPSAMRVTSGLTRGAMALLAFLLCGATAWSAFVYVPVQIKGTGVFVDTSGELLNAVRAPMEGVIEAILVNEGDYVSEGQVVARLRLPERAVALARAESRLASLQSRATQRAALEQAETEIEALERSVRIGGIEQRITNLEQELEWRRDLESAQEMLKSRGVSTNSRVYEAQIATQSVIGELADARSNLQALKVAPLLKQAERDRTRLAEEMEIAEAEAEIIGLRSELARGAALTSPVHGVVAELSVERNGLVTPGQPVLSVIPENFSKLLDAMFFVSLSDGKMVEVGDQVYLTPLSMPAREQGRLRGTVMEISEAPITEQALVRMLGNTALASSAAAGGAPFAVRVALHRDPTTVSGYAWTSGNGPAMRLSPGTPLEGKITVERETLLTLALPALRRFFEGKL